MSRVIMPRADWKDILDATREMTGETDLLLSGDVGSKIRSISSGGGGETVGEFDLTVSFFDYMSEPMPRTGYYIVDGGAARFFEGEKVVTIIDGVNSDSVVKFYILDVGSPGAAGSDCSVDYDFEYIEIDGMETAVCVYTVQNFTADATVTIYEG